MAQQTKTAVTYKQRSVVSGAHCNKCTKLKRPVACTAVSGRIWRRGWCSAFVLKPTYHP